MVANTNEEIIVTAWILVSDASRARLLSAERRQRDWSVVQEFAHPEGREKSMQMDPTPPGSARASMAGGTRHTTFERRTTPKEAEAERFAQRLADYLDHGVANRLCESLVLVAPPHFLGLLRGCLNRQTAKHLLAKVDKYLSMLDARALRERLLGIVFPEETVSR